MVIINGVEIDPKIYSKGQDGQGKSQETKTLTKKFQASNLSLNDLIADITIEPGNANEIEVELTAPQSVIDNIEFKQHGDEVIISAQGSGHSVSIGGMNISNVFKGTTIQGNFCGSDMVIVNGDVVRCSGGDIHISDNGSASKAKLVIKAPHGNEISIDSVLGDVCIGDLECDLEVDIGGSGTVSAASVGDLDAEISGSGQVAIERISGDAECEISGSGRINLSSGKVGKLRASVSGSGSIVAKVTAKTAKLSVSGVGNIHVDRVLTQPKKSRSGLGKIQVDSVG